MNKDNNEIMFDIALYEKEVDCGLTRYETIKLFDMLKWPEAIPLEVEAKYHESVAMGFISTAAANDLDYNMSSLQEFVANILDDMNNETEDGIYEFSGLKMYLSRN